MSEEQQKQEKIRCGQVDPRLVFLHLYGYSPDRNDVDRVRLALSAASPYLNRCQHDLMAAEFGKEVTTVAEIVQTTDTLFVNPPDANDKKLSDALNKIREYL